MKVDSNQLFHLQILNAAEKYNNQIALVDGKTRESITFGQFRKRAFQFATVLSAHMFPSSGNNIRDTVLVVMPNAISYPFVFCGSALLGNPICGINPSATKEELQNAAMKCGAQYIVCTAELLEALLEAFDGTKMPIFVFGKHILSPHRSQPIQEIIDLNSEMEIAPFDEELVETLSARSRALVTIDDVLLAPLSSGTLAEPKCVQLTHKNFNAATIALKGAVFDELSESLNCKTNLAFLPFFHASGFWALCFCLLHGHKSIIELLNLAPTIINYLTKNKEQFENFDLSSIKAVLSGSAPIGKEQIVEFVSVYPRIKHFVQGYGMTEVVCLSHVTPLMDSILDNPNLGSCGKLIPGFEAMIVDPDTGDIRKDPNEAGELWLRSDCVMKGYLKNRDLTEKSFEEKWYKTGDIVFKNEEEYYFVVDRLKNMIKVNGMQVSPVEIEQLILTFPYVSETAVIGIQDSDYGEVPLAFIVLKQELLNGKTQYVALEEIREFVHGKVASYKQLKGGLIAVKKIPKNSAGKVSKKDLQALAIAEHETVL
uniref:Uncharacterized protein n=1 Tax=Panagrolaimus sp. PS1159 TaxID=55785 RepID=A0AC35FKE7_9BILA